MSAQDLLHNSKHNKHKNRFLLQVSNFYSAQNRVGPHFNCKLIIQNKKLLMKTNTCFYSRSEIANQAHSTSSFYFSILFWSILDPQSYIEFFFRYKQQKPVLVFALFFVIKDILCTCIFLVSIHLTLLNCHHQLASSSCQEIEGIR